MTQKNSIQEGEIYTRTFLFSQHEVEKFAEVTGDKNPVHLDENFASQTPFKRPILHGFLGASIFSKVFGTEFPREGSIYLRQDMKFLRPMYPETEYEAVFEVISVNQRRHRAVIKTEVKDMITNKIMISGEAEIMNSERFF